MTKFLSKYVPNCVIEAQTRALSAPPEIRNFLCVGSPCHFSNNVNVEQMELDHAATMDNSLDSDDGFFDANTFSFGSDMGLSASDLYDDVDVSDCGVQFNPVVAVFGGGQIPLAAGDGYWDTLQFVRESDARCDSLTNVFGDDASEGSMSTLGGQEPGRESANDSSGSISASDLNPPENDVEGDADEGEVEDEKGGIGLMGAFSAAGYQFVDYLSKAFNDDDEDDLLLDENDPQNQVQNVVAESTGRDSILQGSGIASDATSVNASEATFASNSTATTGAKTYAATSNMAAKNGLTVAQ